MNTRIDCTALAGKQIFFFFALFNDFRYRKWSACILICRSGCKLQFFFSLHSVKHTLIPFIETGNSVKQFRWTESVVSSMRVRTISITPCIQTADYRNIQLRRKKYTNKISKYKTNFLPFDHIICFCTFFLGHTSATQLVFLMT